MIHNRTVATAPPVGGTVSGVGVYLLRLGSVGPAVTSRVTWLAEWTSKTIARAALRVTPMGPCGTSWNVMAGVTRLTQVSAVSQRSVSTRSLPCLVTNPILFHLPATKSS